MVKIERPTLPKGGGALTGIAETFQPHAFTGTAGLTIPIPTSACRGFEPHLSLDYSSGSGNGVFGIGFSLALPCIARKTARAIPRYDDSDTFVISNTDDLVPAQQGPFRVSVDAVDYDILRYRPRVEGLFSRIEKWTRVTDSRIHWRVTSKDNITSVYGRSEEACVADPADNTRVFQWLIERSDDAKGQQIVYEYFTEQGNKYIHKIKYGNYHPNTQPASDDWHFEVGFSYSDPATRETIGKVNKTGPDRLTRDRARPDAYSSYKSGFRIYTSVRCTRIAMAHRFRGEFEGRCVEVNATEFDYGDSVSASALSLLEAVTHLGCREGMPAQSVPPVVFSWSTCRLGENFGAAAPSDIAFKALTLGVGSSIPGFLAKGAQQLVDLYGEGIPGVLYTDADTVLYARPLGGGTYAPFAAAHAVPIERNLQAAEHALIDLSGDGQLDWVVTTSSRAGYYESTRDESWGSFRSFVSAPTQLRYSQRQMVDVTGDGLADLLLFEADAVTVFPSMGKRGYDRSLRILADSTLPVTRNPSEREAIHFTNLFGDGGSHLVRIRHGCVECWPNLGYGRFGQKVEMANAPRFDGELDTSRLFLADIDGSGTTDLLYVYPDHVDIYRNESGSRFSDPVSIPLPQGWSSLGQISVADVLGNGTTCLVLSSMKADLSLDHRYCDFTDGVKPYLLVGVDNNMGASTRIQYSPSTRFYLADKAAGVPWATRLPFPVQVVEKIETTDHIGGSRLVAEYSYHHGFFDPIDREFRGFGRVDRTDAECFEKFSAAGANDASLHVPPVLTRTWYHTGASADAAVISRDCAAEYCKTDGSGQPLPDSVFDAALQSATPGDLSEAWRALHGHVLREEIYGLDPSDHPALCERPYTVTESNYHVRLVQPKGDRPYAVSQVQPRETLACHCERSSDEPRISHSLTLEVDDYGNVLKSLSIAYGRREAWANPALTSADADTQARSLITFSEHVFTNAVTTPTDYLTPQPSQSRSFELTGFRPGSEGRFSFDEWARRGADWWVSAAEIPFEQTADLITPQKRLVGHTRSVYRKNDLTALLPLGAIESLALQGQSHELALTPGLLRQVFKRSRAGKPDDELLPVPDPLLCGDGASGGYVNIDGQWWVPSGRVFFDPDADIDQPARTAVQELDNARRHFYLPRMTVDAWGAADTVSFDEYDLLPVETCDALGNRVTAGERRIDGSIDPDQPGNDYRVLKPWRVMDANRNRSQVAFDALGRVVGTAVMGKPEEALGDSLAGFVVDLPEAVMRDHLANPLADPLAILGRATTRRVYDVFAYQRSRREAALQPAVCYALARETHAADVDPDHGQPTKVQHSFSYADGLGREIQQKHQAPPENVDQYNAPARWVGSGWTVYNNKGKPVRKYEPFFTDTHGFEFDRRIGVSPVLFYV
jgi:hypothetical protein